MLLLHHPTVGIDRVLSGRTTLADTVYNFLYRERPRSFVDRLIGHTRGDVTVSNTLRRNFWW